MAPYKRAAADDPAVVILKLQRKHERLTAAPGGRLGRHHRAPRGAPGRAREGGADVMSRPMTEDERAATFGEVTADDGSVWVRCMPLERIAETFPDAAAIEQQLHLVPIVADTDEDEP